MSIDLSHLSPDHQKMLLEDSSITTEVVKESGAFTATKKQQLADLGFPKTQQIVPALVLPVHSVTGEVDGYQIRPDKTPMGKDGKPAKYLTKVGQKMLLHIPTRCLPLLGNPNIPAYITEGIKKTLSLVSRNRCAIGFLGVWNFRGANDDGGIADLADWGSIAFKHKDGTPRLFYIVYDSDVMTKWQVHQALARVKALIERRGGEVRLVYLPDGPHGQKQGVDDFFAAGGTIDELHSFATPVIKAFEGDGSSGKEKNAAARVQWEGEQEVIRRPLALLSDTALAVCSLPVQNTEGDTVPELFAITEAGEGPLDRDAMRGRGWRLSLGEGTTAEWSKAGIRAFLDGHRPEGMPLLDEISGAFLFYVGFDPVPPLTAAKMARLLALSVFASYFLEAFPAIGFIHFTGPKGSGKSKTQAFHASLCFNGEFVIHSTTTAAIRRLAASGGTLALDDTERLNQKDDPDRYYLLLSGYRSDATFPLVEEDGQGQKRVVRIPVYAPRTFSSIKGLPDTLRSRTIVFPLVRTNGPQANRTPGIGASPCRDSGVIRDDLMAFTLPRLREAKNMYAELATQSEVMGRDFEITAPYLVMAQLIGGEELRAEVLQDLQSLLNIGETEAEEAREVPVLRAVLRLAEGKELLRVSPQEIADYIAATDSENNTYIDARGNEATRFTRYVVGRILKGLQVGQAHRQAGGMEYEISTERLGRRAEAFGGKTRILQQDTPEKTTQTTQATRTTQDSGEWEADEEAPDHVVYVDDAVCVASAQGAEDDARVFSAPAAAGDAERFLLQALADGPVWTEAVFMDARQAGIPIHSLRDAVAALGVVVDDSDCFCLPSRRT